MEQGPRLSCATVAPMPVRAGQVAWLALQTEPGLLRYWYCGFVAKSYFHWLPAAEVRMFQRSSMVGARRSWSFRVGLASVSTARVEVAMARRPTRVVLSIVMGVFQ